MGVINMDKTLKTLLCDADFERKRREKREDPIIKGEEVYFPDR